MSLVNDTYDFIPLPRQVHIYVHIYISTSKI